MEGDRRRWRVDQSAGLISGRYGQVLVRRRHDVGSEAVDINAQLTRWAADWRHGVRTLLIYDIGWPHNCPGAKPPPFRPPPDRNVSACVQRQGRTERGAMTG